MKTKELFFSVLVFIGMLLLQQSCIEPVDDLNAPPTCKIIMPPNGSVIVQQDVVSIVASAQDTDGYVQIVKFYVNDAQVDSSSYAPYEGLWNTYSFLPGLYTLKAVAVDDKGTTGSDEIKVEIIEHGTTPIADFTVSDSIGTAPLTVTFTDKSLNQPTSWSWDFGDGTTSSEQNPSHTYQNEGTYTVSLTASNDYGEDTKTCEKCILVNAGENQIFTDSRDGKTYNIVTIGDQIWFAENLNYEAPGSWYYEDNAQYGEIYGRLYSWGAAKSSCPDGWHLPTDGEWKTLERYLGMSDAELDKEGWRGTEEGAKLKSPNYWSSGVGYNTVGFTALPGGIRDDFGNFMNIENAGGWWTATKIEEDEQTAWYRELHYHYKGVFREYGSKNYGRSVRCVKD